MPGPKSVPTQSVFSSRQATCDLASGSEKPPETNCLSAVSNSRNTEASEPPRASRTMQRTLAGGRQPASWKTHDLPSALASASTSSTVSHSGEAERYEASDVRRQMPRSCASSFQKL